MVYIGRIIKLIVIHVTRYNSQWCVPGLLKWLTRVLWISWNCVIFHGNRSNCHGTVMRYFISNLRNRLLAGFPLSVCLLFVVIRFYRFFPCELNIHKRTTICNKEMCRLLIDISYQHFEIWGRGGFAFLCGSLATHYEKWKSPWGTWNYYCGQRGSCLDALESQFNYRKWRRNWAK